MTPNEEIGCMDDERRPHQPPRKSGNTGCEGREATCRRPSPNGASPAADWGRGPPAVRRVHARSGELRDPRQNRLPQHDVVVSASRSRATRPVDDGSRTSPHSTLYYLRRRNNNITTRYHNIIVISPAYRYHGSASRSLLCV
ncbi:hypothetical protein QTP88_016644 [Uroleucon formosanum]